MDLPPPLIVVLFLTSILRTTNEVFGDPNETAHTMDHGKILEASKQFSAWSSGMHHAKSRNTPGIDIESGFKLCKFVKFFEYNIYIYHYISPLPKQQADKDLKPALIPLIGFVHRALLGKMLSSNQAFWF